jgi:integrase-like protein
VGPTTRAVGLDGLRFHDLRHTAGTLAARTGATTKEIMSRLGHSSARAAMIYQHATNDRDRLIADRLAAMTEEAGLAPVLPMVAKNDPARSLRMSAGSRSALPRCAQLTLSSLPAGKNLVDHVRPAVTADDRGAWLALQRLERAANLHDLPPLLPTRKRCPLGPYST